MPLPLALAAAGSAAASGLGKAGSFAMNHLDLVAAAGVGGLIGYQVGKRFPGHDKSPDVVTIHTEKGILDNLPKDKQIAIALEILLRLGFNIRGPFFAPLTSDQFCAIYPFGDGALSRAYDMIEADGYDIGY